MLVVQVWPCIAAAVGCAIVDWSLCLSLSFNSCERFEGVGGKVGLSDAIAEKFWFAGVEPCCCKHHKHCNQCWQLSTRDCCQHCLWERSYSSKQTHCKSCPAGVAG